MRLHRFFVKEQLGVGKEIRLDTESADGADLIHQWKNVFRLSKGDKMILLDNTGFEYDAEIVLLTKDEAVVSLGDRAAVRNIQKKEVWLFASLIKKDHFEWVLEKATELGVSHFVPVVSERSEKKNLNIERAEKIIKEASEQSGRGMLPMLHEITDLTEAIEQAKNLKGAEIVTFHPEGTAFDRKTIASAGIVALFIGPEGGWSDREVQVFKEKDITICTLGNQVLRAETAAIAVCALVLL